MKVPMLKNSDSKSSASFTMAFISFNLICLWLLLFIICPIFGITTIPNFDGSDAMMFLSPILANYFGQKYLEATKTNKDESK